MNLPGLEPVRVLGHFLAARRRFTRFRDRAELVRWQRRRLVAHLRWTARHSPFYRAWFARTDAEAADPGAWPRMDKALMNQNLPALLTQPINVSKTRTLTERAMATREFAGRLPGGITAGLSSGTTGPAALFLVSAPERAAWAGLALARVLRGMPWGREPQRVAFFLRANSPLYETVGGRGRAVRFVYFDLLTPLEESFAAWERLAPTTLVAPPGALRTLAAARRAGELRGPPPRQIVSVAETLDADDRRAVEAAFGVRVDEVYQATEGFLAATCPAGALHWNEDAVCVEREPLEGNPDAAGGGHGERYVPVLTDFRRRLQPFVRYRLNDVLSDEPDDAPPCPCGSVFRRLRRIEGRQDDALRLARRDGLGSGALFPDFVRLAVAGAASAGMEDFRVRQTGPGSLAVSVRPPGPAGDGFLSRLESALAETCARAGLQTPVCRLAPWPETDGGDRGRKRRRVVGPDTQATPFHP